MRRKEDGIKVSGFCLVSFLSIIGIMIFGAQQVQAKEVTLTMVTSRFGSGAYVMGYAIEKITKEAKHPWLRVISSEGVGGEDNIVSFQEYSSEQKATHVLNAGDAGYMAALKGSKPWFDKPVKGLRGVCMLGTASMFFVSFDPKLTTIYDLAGKTLGGPAKGASAAVRLDVFLDAAGIRDKVNIRWLGSKGADALSDRKVDAIYGMSFRCEVTPDARPLFATLGNKLFIAEIPQELFVKAKAAGWPLRSARLEPGCLLPNQKTEITVHRVIASSWWIGENADPEAVYEFVKMIYENVDQFKDYVSPSQLPIRAEMGYLPVDSEAEIHPGALKFFKEKGLKVGAP